MKKPIDFDALFDEKLAQYMQEHAGQYTEKQWSALIPKLYLRFGDTFVRLAGDTPKGYYAKMTDDELVQMLCAYVEQGVSVSDFLLRELETRNCPDSLLPLLESENEELLMLAIHLSDGNEKAFDRYFCLLLEQQNEDIKDSVIEVLREHADAVKQRALAEYEQGRAREYMLEILSRCKQRDDRVFNVLLTAFRTSPDELPMHAAYLASYGDERALPVLLDYIDRDEINYLEYQELKYAIEALGGEYTRVRDFSEDPYFQEIAAQSQILPDFTGQNKKTDA